MNSKSLHSDFVDVSLWSCFYKGVKKAKKLGDAIVVLIVGANARTPIGEPHVAPTREVARDSYEVMSIHSLGAPKEEDEIPLV